MIIDYRILKLGKFAAVQDQFLCAKVQSILVALHFVCSGDGTRQIVTPPPKKLNQSASMQLQTAMNIFHDPVMQCLHCLRNAHDQGWIHSFFF